MKIFGVQMAKKETNSTLCKIFELAISDSTLCKIFELTISEV